MSKTNQCLASLARLNLSAPSRPLIQTTIPRVLAPATTVTAQQRHAAVKSASGKPKKVDKYYPAASLKPLPQYSLCDAMRYLRAAEVGQDPFAVKYDLAIRLQTLRTAPPVRNRLQLPHPVTSNRRIGVICKEGTALASQAIQEGAFAAGEESVFDMVREGTVEFTAMICHQGSAEALKRADLGRLLGPKGLMPSAKTKTITTDIIPLLQEMTTAEQYREKMGVVRFPVGQLWFSPEMLSANIKAAIQSVRDDCQALLSQMASPKQVVEIVLSTSHGPGFSLNGSIKSTDPYVTTRVLSGSM